MLPCSLQKILFFTFFPVTIRSLLSSLDRDFTGVCPLLSLLPPSCHTWTSACTMFAPVLGCPLVRRWSPALRPGNKHATKQLNIHHRNKTPPAPFARPRRRRRLVHRRLRVHAVQRGNQERYVTYYLKLFAGKVKLFIGTLWPGHLLAARSLRMKWTLWSSASVLSVCLLVFLWVLQVSTPHLSLLS